jgi:hypothetical protein
VNSGAYAAHVFDPDEQSDQQLATTSAVAIPASATQAQLHFAHRFSFETPDFDGGVLEVSTNGGTVWTDAGANITQGGYTGVITATGGNPLSGRPAWVGAMPGYPNFSEVTVNLLPYAGQSLKFRFREASDLNTGAPGWWVDDISVLVVQPCGTGTPTPTAGAVLVGHVTWQGRPAQPNALQVLPLTLTLKSAVQEVNYPLQYTDAGGFFTTSVGTLPPGLYNWRVKSAQVGATPPQQNPGWLSTSGTVALTGVPVTQQEMGLQKAGDCDNSDVVSSPDFIVMKNTFGHATGEPGYDSRADINGDTVVNALDFSHLRANFGQSGAPPIGPTASGVR